ncbi:response regulator receiver sensor signal transduction histidine kinase [Candidatus Magnetoovum chiemensis]|nr:response regulator receiver sensor signal transduction histidine kinase [Candidatus Magnetoovum chiemensis]
MIVEDEIIIAKDIKRSLENFGYCVTSIVSSGEKAVNRANVDRPDLILMDIVLQGEMDGIEAANLIRSRLNIPIIYITAYADDRILQRAKLTGPVGYMIKPFEDRQIHTVIEMALYKHKTDEAMRQQRERFISVLLHDLKNPLLALYGNIKRINDGKIKKDEDKTSVIKIIQEISEDLLVSIENNAKSLKEKSALETYAPKDVNLKEVLFTVIRNTHHDVKDKGIKLFFNNKIISDYNDIADKIDMDKIFFTADLFQIKSMIENLIGNALKYAKSTIMIKLDRNDNEIIFKVCDDGPGIAPIYHDKIFQEYFQVPGSKKGTGIGLYSVKKIVESHNGTISVNSNINEGACFEVLLPFPKC